MEVPTNRKVEFKTTVPGTYFYQCYAHSNMGGSFTVVDPDKSDIVNKDVSFNGNIDVDFSSNYVTGVNKKNAFYIPSRFQLKNFIKYILY